MEKHINKLQVEAANNDRHVREAYGNNGGNKNENVGIEDMISFIENRHHEKVEKNDRTLS